MSAITWLHISDIHLRESGLFDSQVVIDSLLTDISKREEIAPELKKIRLIFITGDLAYSGKESEYVIVKNFIDNLIRVTKTSRERIFVIPGNHDVDRSKISDESRAIVDKLGSEQAVNELLGNPIDLSIIIKRLEGYNNFARDHFDNNTLFEKSDYFYVKKIKIYKKRVSILGLNSAWASSSDQDQLNLFLGERQVRDALKRAKPADLCFVLMHHPFRWLRDFDSDLCEPLLLDNGNIILHGHLHKTGITFQQTPSANSLVIGAGAGYEKRSHLNSYSLGHLNLENGTGTLYLRTYSDRDGGFWSDDTTSYRGIQGKLTFTIQTQLQVNAGEPSSNLTAPVIQVNDTRVDEVKPDTGETITSSKVVPTVSSALRTWWQKRGYNNDPFLFDNAKDLATNDNFQHWYVDPNLSASISGFSRPTIDDIIAVETSGPVLIFAPSGGGKTFCRILSIEQIKATYTNKIVDISNINSKLLNPEQVSGLELMMCICRAVSLEFNFQPTATPGFTQHVLAACDAQIRSSFPSDGVLQHIFTFVDDLDQLFSEHDSEKNRKALMAISELCKTAANQNDTLLALRLFLPLEIKEQLLELLGVRTRQKIRVVTLRWDLDHCETVLEARLNSNWKDGPNEYFGNHLGRLLHEDALTELRRQLKDSDLSPRCIIQFLRELSYYAYKSSLNHENAIGSKMIVDFLEDNLSSVCPRIYYPVSNALVPNIPEQNRKINKNNNKFIKVSAKISYVIDRIAWLKDWLDSLKILGITIAVILFFLWLLFQEIWLGQHIDLYEYLKKIWDFIVGQIK
ncbi:MAG: 3',5'-cyclic adenosine monophosphate phosphodiesterase CpdA [Anaerolineales bacterium]|nr:3',5'-cyclic adenosine monophosphate phosphodiesterase CpdA [Anaerolineales bacterium]